jgi:hypothetical protein
MTREPKGLPPNGPVKQIDWDLVDEMLKKGCVGTQIAARIGIHADTLYHRCEDEKGVLFSAYAQQKREKGDALLHETQFNLAMKEDRGMLIWLGKQRLGQKDNPGQPVIPEQFLQLFADTMKVISSQQQSQSIDLNSDDTNSSTDSRSE